MPYQWGQVLPRKGYTSFWEIKHAKKKSHIERIKSFLSNVTKSKLKIFQRILPSSPIYLAPSKVQMYAIQLLNIPKNIKITIMYIKK